ncbi:RecQ family ATP-dependent DNA helicase [Liberiplasma polymorphum]|uniref:RecQ family ATP-dependent DNA helicase n=1 Tax=Liberiplasma polymorphum TaxID=3374570 RepID=UPI0037761816
MILFFDVEVDPKSQKIIDYGCIVDNERKEVHSVDFKKIAKLVKKADFYCGHNALNHDINYINHTAGYELIRASKVIDTLYLSTLLFPQKPYHALVKDHKLQPEDSNNPLIDSKQTKVLYDSEVDAFNALTKGIKNIFYALLKDVDGFSAFFNAIKYDYNLTFNLESLITEHYEDKVCSHVNLTSMIKNNPVELAYALALINTNTDSLFPSWVLHQFPKCEEIMLLLRSNPCDQNCNYCNHHLNAKNALSNYFGYDDFKTFDGLPLQEMAVDAAIRNKSMITVFPTGGGKSLTYQLPALMRGELTRSLTVVISPLQSLMKDQVDNLEEKLITQAAAISGLLDPIERLHEINRVLDGEVSILYIAPESLRSKTIERLLLSRDIARFVIDEAHCFSTWGHDFRVDYLYIGEFIKLIQEKKNNNKKIPVSCFTATAKKDVIYDIENYFRNKLDIEMEKITSNSARKNLRYKVYNVKDSEDKYQTLRRLLEQRDCFTIIYAARTKTVDNLNDRLNSDGYLSAKFHGQMDKEDKIQEQDRFMQGIAKVMVATSAFGMGVDKKDVEMVIHYEISDSLENYVQESGRAGRDEKINADCFILYNENDLDKHFQLHHQSKLNIQEVQQIWRAIKQVTKIRNSVSQSALEIAKNAGWDEEIRDVETRVRTAIAALEDVGYLKRKQNNARVFANSILAENVEQANKIIDSSSIIPEEDRINSKRIIKSLISSKYSKRGRDVESESRVDYLSDYLGIPKEDVVKIINYFKEIKLLDDFKDLVCYLKNTPNENTLIRQLDVSYSLEKFLVNELSEDEHIFNLKELNEAAIEQQIKSSVKVIGSLLNYLEIIKVIKKRKNKDSVRLKLSDSKEDVLESINNKYEISRFILQYISDKSRKVDSKNDEIIQVQFSVVELKNAFHKQGSLFEKVYSVQDFEDSLYYLKKIDAITIEGGFLVLYSPMFIERTEKNVQKKYTKKDFEKLEQFYRVKMQQIHIVGEYAAKMVDDYESALKFVDDYFKLEYKDFILRYFKGDKKVNLDRNISPSKFEKLFGGLSLKQRNIVNDHNSQTIVVAAGPGSGKTRILVHKLASILLMEDIRKEQLLMLTFSRSAASEFKSRLIDLIGSAAYYIDIKTFHSFCFDILGKMGTIEKSENVIKNAIELISNNEVDTSKITKMVLVIDEAQDMDAIEYELVQLLKEFNENLRIIAVGDDDQNIYGFRGSSSEYLNHLRLDNAAFYELTENYRSLKNLVEFSNYFVQSIDNRMKSKEIVSKQAINGTLELFKHQGSNLETPISKHVINLNLKGSTAVLTRTNAQAIQITGLLIKEGLNAKLIQSNIEIKLHNIREIRYFMELINPEGNLSIITNDVWKASYHSLKRFYSTSSEFDVVSKIIKKFQNEYPENKYLSDFKEFLFESTYEEFIESNTILVSTLHKAKGREFDNVFILYDRVNELDIEEKRLLYVGMTRAKSNLYIHYCGNHFDGYKEYATKYYDVNKTYDKPTRLVFLLSHSDVSLGLFEFTQYYIRKLKNGYLLDLAEDEYLLHEGKKVLRFSKTFKQKIQDLKEQGYKLETAKIRHIIYWFDMEKEQEYLIALPELTFELEIDISNDDLHEKIED